MSLRGSTLTLAVVTMLLLTSVGPVTAVPDARITVSDATVTPTTPVVGEQVVVSVTIANSVGSPSAVEIESVRLEDPEDDKSARAQRLGTLSPGDSVTVPLALTFETAGPRKLSLTVSGTDEDGDDVRIERPVPIAVEDAPPLVDVRIEDAAVDAETRVAVSLSNPTTADMRNIVVSVADFGGTTPVRTASVATLPAGATEVRNLTVVPAEVGESTLELAVNYTTASGTERTLRVDVPIQTSEFADDVQLTLRPVREADDAAAAPDIVSLLAGGGGAGAALGGGVTDGADDESAESTVRFDVVVTNFGSAPISDIVVEPTTESEVLPRLSILGPIPSGESGTATLDLSEVRDAGPLTLRATYRVGVQSAETATTIEYRPAVADLVFTDLDVTVEDGDIRILGNVANQGRGDAEGVVVELAETDTVTPRYPQRDYFVGRITPSDFAPFELTGSVAEDATDVTVTVRYTVDGAEVVRETVVDVPSETQSGGFSVSGLGGGEASEVQPGVEPTGLVSGLDSTTRNIVVVALVVLLVLPVAVAIRIRRDAR
ncbi:hypothetical protein [Haloferax profundi]|uniref:CARDB domain-containing protein n=1 Tax=Haloferax profundi TaxID=1544718 RepID=A0A0W1SKC9_9EURY|nr:hypothetical protein [Haloferax profundi]KTG26689.1 hypothetical protein AUR66_15915 [Haloferax profundi]